MTEYQIRWGRDGKYAGSSLPKARQMAVKVLLAHPSFSYVGIFGNTDEAIRPKYGRVGRTNTIYYTWEVPINGGGYKIENFLDSDGKIARPPQWFYFSGNFYY